MYTVWLVFPTLLLAGETIGWPRCEFWSYSFGCLAVEILITGFLTCCIKNWLIFKIFYLDGGLQMH